MVEVLYLAKNRLEYTKASLKTLLANTKWDADTRLVVYDDDSCDGTREYLKEQVGAVTGVELVLGEFGSPVAVMNHYLCRRDPLDPEGNHMFAKVDSDTIVPPGWLDQCLRVMERYPTLGLLGIEAMTPVDHAIRYDRVFEEARHIGGIGLMRGGAFVTLPRPNGLFGFTAWQAQSPVTKGWLSPSLPVFLLDRLPHQPWASLGQRYVELGWQRPWPCYPEKDAQLWQWWQP